MKNTFTIIAMCAVTIFYSQSAMAHGKGHPGRHSAADVKNCITIDRLKNRPTGLSFFVSNCSIKANVYFRTEHGGCQSGTDIRTHLPCAQWVPAREEASVTIPLNGYINWAACPGEYLGEPFSHGTIPRVMEVRPDGNFTFHCYHWGYGPTSEKTVAANDFTRKKEIANQALAETVQRLASTQARRAYVQAKRARLRAKQAKIRTVQAQTKAKVNHQQALEREQARKRAQREALEREQARKRAQQEEARAWERLRKKVEQEDQESERRRERNRAGMNQWQHLMDIINQGATDAYLESLQQNQRHRNTSPSSETCVDTGGAYVRCKTIE